MKTIASIGGRHPVLGALLALGVAACTGPGAESAAVESPALKGSEIQAFLAQGTDWQFRSSDGAHGTSAFRSDGSSEVNWQSGGHSGHAVGTAWVEGDKLCARYPALRHGSRICGRLVRLDANRYRLHKDEGGTTTYIAIR